MSDKIELGFYDLATEAFISLHHMVSVPREGDFIKIGRKTLSEPVPPLRRVAMVVWEDHFSTMKVKVFLS